MSLYELDSALVRGSLVFRRVGSETAVEIPGDGVLELPLSSGSSVTLASGTLRGIRFLDENGEAVVPNNDEAHVKVIRAALGQSVTIVHNDGTVAEPTERIVTSSLQNITLTARNLFAFYVYTMAASSFRWFVPDEDAFTAAVAGNWSPTPTRISEALDQLATRTPVTTSGSAAITSGVPLTLWTYTLAEGECIGGRLTLTAAIVSAGAVSRSRGFIDFGASRDVGGAAAATLNDMSESGTLAGGVLSVTASGNDVLVQVTYTATATLAYVTRLIHDSVTPA